MKARKLIGGALSLSLLLSASLCFSGGMSAPAVAEAPSHACCDGTGEAPERGGNKGMPECCLSAPALPDPVAVLDVADTFFVFVALLPVRVELGPLAVGPHTPRAFPDLPSLSPRSLPSAPRAPPAARPS